MYVHVDIIQLLFLLIFCLFCDGVLQYNKNELSDIFIENLKVDPILLGTIIGNSVYFFECIFILS